MSVDPETPPAESSRTPLAAAAESAFDAQSSVASAADSTMSKWLPSRPAIAAPTESAARANVLALQPGERIGEFMIEKTLGRGGFGVVYLAKQTSLDRHVALKVMTKTTGTDGEGRSLARLEHDHIVQVYSEIYEPLNKARLLCMQYVAGTTLSVIVREVARFDSGHWTGADFLSVLDSLNLPQAVFDPAAMHDRDVLLGADHVEAVSRIGEQLARALEHAHSRGVLHRDVKPANVLVNRYGRPLLADFNLAVRENDREGSTTFGGTLAYMSPEHLDAFDPDSTMPDDAVDARSDVYSLAVVLWELSSGGRPYPTPGNPMQKDELSAVLKEQSLQRRTLLPQNPPRDHRLARLLERGLAPDPTDRYSTAGDFAASLTGLRQQRAALRALPPLDTISRWGWQHPIAALVLAGLLPQFFGSALQISYNALRIVGSLTPEQAKLFPYVVIAYNLVAYPACLTWLLRRLIRVVRVWQALRRGEAVTDEEVREARRGALGLPCDTAIIATIGWFPGAIIFPLALHVGAGALPWNSWQHFIVSFALAGTIAVTYSYFLGLGVVLRTMYLRFWSNPRAFREHATVELAAIPDRLRTVNVLAGIIPLAGAMLLVLVGPSGFIGDDNYDAFRVLTASLILASMAGYVAVGKLSRGYLGVVSACTGGTRSNRR